MGSLPTCQISDDNVRLLTYDPSLSLGIDREVVLVK
jgi:hypothetical protein